MRYSKLLLFFLIENTTDLKNIYFSYDTRGAHSEQPAHWIDMDVLQNRATFNIVRDNVDGELLLKPVMVNMFLFF